MVKGKPLVRQGGRTLQGKIGNEDVEGLGTSATRDVGTSEGQVPEFVSSGDGLGGFGYGRVGTSVGRYADANNVPKRTGSYLLVEGHPNSTNNKAPLAGFYDTAILRTSRQSADDFVDVYLPYPSHSPGMVIAPHTSGGYATQRIVSDSVNLRTGTGNSTVYPMSQKATTDAINARGFADASGILTVTSGALSNDMSSFLSQTTKETMRSNLEVPQLNASATQQGGLKARLEGTTLYLTNDGTNP